MTKGKTLAQVYWEIEDRFKAAIEKHRPAKNVNELIKMFCTTRDEACLKEGRIAHLGHATSLDILRKAMPPGFKEVEEWEDWPYRVVWVSEKELATCTYCEGDVSIVTLKDKKAFKRELAEAAEFYENR